LVNNQFAHGEQGQSGNDQGKLSNPNLSLNVQTLSAAGGEQRERRADGTDVALVYHCMLVRD